MSSTPNPATGEPAPPKPAFAEALRYWLRLGFINFGGPTGQIAIMHTDLVDRKRWISENRFLHALNYCMLLPGPEAQQLATYIGLLLHGARGGIVAGALFIVPSFFLMWVLSYVMVVYGDVRWIAALFYGLQVATIAIVAAAVLRIGKRAVKNRAMWAIAVASFVAIYFFGVNFAVIVFSAALIGFLGGRWKPNLFITLKGHSANNGGTSDSVLGDDSPTQSRPSLARALRVVLTGLVIWWTPILLVGVWLGWQSTVFQEGLFFSKAALITFGGAYAVLPYVAQVAVQHYGWLTTGQMMSGLALAESTPGPLIMVLQIAGFIGAWNHPGNLSPILAATIGSAITVWATFLPSFIFIFAGAPYIEHLREVKLLNAALSAVTAAVVGVMVNLGVWFALHIIHPATGKLDAFALVLASILFIAMQRFKWGIIPVVAIGGLLGLVWQLA